MSDAAPDTHHPFRIVEAEVETTSSGAPLVPSREKRLQSFRFPFGDDGGGSEATDDRTEPLPSGSEVGNQEALANGGAPQAAEAPLPPPPQLDAEAVAGSPSIRTASMRSDSSASPSGVNRAPPRALTRRASMVSFKLSNSGTFGERVQSPRDSPRPKPPLSDTPTDPVPVADAALRPVPPAVATTAVSPQTLTPLSDVPSVGQTYNSSNAAVPAASAAEPVIVAVDPPAASRDSSPSAQAPVPAGGGSAVTPAGSFVSNSSGAVLPYVRSPPPTVVVSSSNPPPPIRDSPRDVLLPPAIKRAVSPPQVPAAAVETAVSPSTVTTATPRTDAVLLAPTSSNERRDVPSPTPPRESSVERAVVPPIEVVSLASTQRSRDSEPAATTIVVTTERSPSQGAGQSPALSPSEGRRAPSVPKRASPSVVSKFQAVVRQKMEQDKLEAKQKAEEADRTRIELLMQLRQAEEEERVKLEEQQKGLERERIALEQERKALEAERAEWNVERAAWDAERTVWASEKAQWEARIAQYEAEKAERQRQENEQRDSTLGKLKATYGSGSSLLAQYRPLEIWSPQPLPSPSIPHIVSPNRDEFRHVDPRITRELILTTSFPYEAPVEVPRLRSTSEELDSHRARPFAAEVYHKAAALQHFEPWRPTTSRTRADSENANALGVVTTPKAVTFSSQVKRSSSPGRSGSLTKADGDKSEDSYVECAPSPNYRLFPRKK